MDNPFVRATKEKAKARLALIGPAGVGKTYSALQIGTSWATHTGLAPEGKIALIDSEHGKAAKYAHEFCFDHVIIDNYSPATYTQLINAAGENGYEVLIIDSLSHAWAGKGGALQLVDEAKRRYGDNNYFAWKEVTPLQDALIDSIIASPCHLIATMRAKAEYVVENRNGKQVPKKIGLSAIQRDGVEYEFDVTGRMDAEHNLIIERTSIPSLDNAIVKLPGKDFADAIMTWLLEGAEPQEGYARLQPEEIPNLEPAPAAATENTRPAMPEGQELPINPKTGKPFATAAQLTLARKRGDI